MKRPARTPASAVTTMLAVVGTATLLLVACSSDDDDSSATTSTTAAESTTSSTSADQSGNESSTTAPTSTPTTLKPPDADMPTAGTCGTADIEVVEVVVNPDIPSPRCVQVTADQRLQIRNATDQPATVSLAQHSATLAPGETTLFDQPFGEYLEPGVHRVSMSTYGESGAEIWLQ